MAGAAVTSQDEMFATKAAQAGMAEVKLAQLALSKSNSPEVVAFARRMTADHGKANMELTSILKQKGLTPPGSVGAKNEALMEKLRGENGATFNTAYLKTQLPAHREVLALFQREAASGSDADLVAFAKQTVPVIEMHIAMDQREIARLGPSGSMSMR
jgi:putative membrane protein